MSCPLASPGSSFVEKSIMAAIARLFGVKSLMFPRGAALFAQYRRSPFHRALLRICFGVPTAPRNPTQETKAFSRHEKRNGVRQRNTASGRAKNISVTATANRYGYAPGSTTSRKISVTR